ncbi:MAG TPA: Gfo/Idh/MocA family oxidoreductase [Gemmataceae bacterium]|nr:Gfo/Idh/MocA family oxidoreductase [Gemmataceae bacterium]
MMNQSNQSGSSRREFLKTTAVAAASGALTAGLGFADGQRESRTSAVHAGGSDTIKVGVIGCGGRGSGAADNVLHSARNVKIVALADVFKFRLDGLRQRLNELAQSEEIRKLGNGVDLPDSRCHHGDLEGFKKVINDPEVNYVILATPPGFRPMMLEEAVKAGKNIFTEKPVGVDGPGIRKVLQAYEDAKKKGLAIGAGTQRRHQLGYVETMKRIHDGAIGKITAAQVYWNQGNIWFRHDQDLIDNGIKVTPLASQLWNWYHFVWLCGDHICEQHVHNLDVANWAIGHHPLHAVGMGARVERPHGDPNKVGHIYDFFAIDYEYPDGVHVLSQCRQIEHCADSVSEHLNGTKGTCQADRYEINGKRIITRAQDKASTDPYVQEHTDLIASIRAGKPENELKNVAYSTLTAILGRLSAYTGKKVTWEQALNSQYNTMPESLAWDMVLQTPPVALPGKTRLF